MLRYHLDENVDHAVAVGLRGRGIEVTTTPEIGLRSTPDEQQLAYCHAAGKVLVTHDDDMLTLAAQGINHSGIAFCRSRSRSIGQIVLKLASLSRQFSPDEFANRVEFL
jgi:predicted nuclease of predicted toxin-antitoxin system